MQKVDIAIIGAGLNGLVAGVALAHVKGLSVAIIDQSDPNRFATPAYDSRSSALTQATQMMLETLGLWQNIKAHAQTVGEIIVTDGKTDGRRPSLLSFALDGSGKPALSMVENFHIFASVLERAKSTPNLSFHLEQKPVDIKFGPGLATVRLSDGTVIKASLVIGADGRNSTTRKAAGLKLEGWAYSQSAITLTVSHELPHGGMAEEHFEASGVFAILPLPGNRSSLVWTESHERAQHLCKLDETEFLVELQKRFGNHRGALKVVGPKHLYPLSLFLANQMTSLRLALIGDAAHVIHPLAGLGLNLGFKDAAVLVDCVADALNLGQDIGGAAVLERYATWRRFDTVSSAYMLDGLNRLFSTDNSGLKLLRDTGLKFVDQSAILKAFLVKEATGMSGDVPRLMRGLAA